MGQELEKTKEKSPSCLPKTNIQPNTVVTANLSGRRDYMTSERSWTNDGKKLLSFPSLQAFGKSVMPPTGVFSLQVLLTLPCVFPTVLDIFAISQCTFAYSWRKPINHMKFLIAARNMIWDHFASTSAVRSAISHLGTQRKTYIYFLCYTSKHRFEYPNAEVPYML